MARPEREVRRTAAPGVRPSAPATGPGARHRAGRFGPVRAGRCRDGRTRRHRRLCRSHPRPARGAPPGPSRGRRAGRGRAAGRGPAATHHGARHAPPARRVRRGRWWRRAVRVSRRFVSPPGGRRSSRRRENRSLGVGSGRGRRSLRARDPRGHVCAGPRPGRASTTPTTTSRQPPTGMGAVADSTGQSISATPRKTRGHRRVVDGGHDLPEAAEQEATLLTGGPGQPAQATCRMPSPPSPPSPPPWPPACTPGPSSVIPAR